MGSLSGGQKSMEGRQAGRGLESGVTDSRRGGGEGGGGGGKWVKDSTILTPGNGQETANYKSDLILESSVLI